MSGIIIPKHVNPKLVRENYAFAMGLTTSENPFNDMLPRFHQDADFIYATDAYPIGLPAWIPQRMKDIQAVYSDNEHFSTEGLSPFPMLSGGQWKVTPIEVDPPQHTAYRTILNPLFTPTRLKSLDEKVRQTARDFIAKFKDKGECEFMEDFAFKFPIAVFLDLMGLPQERMEQFLEWEHMLLHSTDLEGIIVGTQQVVAYLQEVIDDRMQNPRDDLVSIAVTSEIVGRKPTNDELIGICFNLYIGGLDTVTTNIAWQVRHLAENPEQQQMLREQPELIGKAVESLYRRYASVTTFRSCIKEISFGDATIMPGDKVAVSTTFANNDPNEWGDPSKVDITQAPRHMVFGYGVHRCVGAALARRESVVAIEELLSTLTLFKPKTGATLNTALGPILQPQNIPLSW